jgi:hypothetical protein
MGGHLRLFCTVCRRCACPRCHASGPWNCGGEPVNRGRRFFLLGALAAPVLAKLPAAALVPGQIWGAGIDWGKEVSMMLATPSPDGGWSIQVQKVGPGQIFDRLQRVQVVLR